MRLLAERYRDTADLPAAAEAGLARTDADFLLVAEALDARRRLNPADGLAKARAALASPVEERRYGACLAMARWKDPAATGPLAERLRSDPVLSVRRKAADALGLLGDPAAAGALVEFLASEPEAAPDRALQAMTARANLRGEIARAAVGGLLPLTAVGRRESVRFFAARALGQAAGSAEARERLAGLLRDPSVAIRSAAADALGDLLDAAARDAVAGAYAREADPGAASSMLDAVWRIDVGGK